MHTNAPRDMGSNIPTKKIPHRNSLYLQKAVFYEWNHFSFSLDEDDSVGWNAHSAACSPAWPSETQSCVDISFSQALTDDVSELSQHTQGVWSSQIQFLLQHSTPPHVRSLCLKLQTTGPRVLSYSTGFALWGPLHFVGILSCLSQGTFASLACLILPQHWLQTQPISPKAQLTIGLQTFLTHGIHYWRMLEDNEGFLKALHIQFDCPSNADLKATFYPMWVNLLG